MREKGVDLIRGVGEGEGGIVRKEERKKRVVEVRVGEREGIVVKVGVIVVDGEIRGLIDEG